MSKIREQKFTCKVGGHMEMNERREWKFIFLRWSLSFHSCRILVVDTAGYFSQLSTFSSIKGERKELRHDKHVFLAVHSSRFDFISRFHAAEKFIMQQRCSICFLFYSFIDSFSLSLCLPLLYLLPFVETVHIYTNGIRLQKLSLFKKSSLVLAIKIK
jgi:hypothetical protein